MAKSRIGNVSPTRRSTPPLPADELADLFAVLEVVLRRRGCDNTLRNSETWLRGRGHDLTRIVLWLKQHGGYCDCEVLFNVVPKVAVDN
jgi:hypothetical protein